MRSILPEGAIEAVAEDNEHGLLASAALIELRHAFPEHADFDIDAKLAELSDEEAKGIREKFRDFLRSRPDLSPLLDAD